jgi:hypothetical protein
VDIAPPSGLPDLRTSIGSRTEGGTAPVVFKTLQRDMTPEQVDTLFPGAKRVGKYGISTVKPTDLPGVDTIDFYFKDGKLFNAELNYKRSLATSSFGDYFRRVVANKYGDSSDKIMTYALANGVMVQAFLFVDHYRLSYALPMHSAPGSVSTR